jgi:hypothetical protein
MLPPKDPNMVQTQKTFRLPYINGKWIVPLMVLFSAFALFKWAPDFLSHQFNITGENAANTIPMLVFFTLCLVLSVMTFLRNLSLIPVLGVLSCTYLLTGMAASNWIWFGVWLLIGLVVYLLYGAKHSKLAKVKS